MSIPRKPHSDKEIEETLRLSGLFFSSIFKKIFATPIETERNFYKVNGNAASQT